MGRKLHVLICALLLMLSCHAACDDLAASFAKPPPSARPWVYWFWLNGNITREGITADLEAMQRVGIGGALIMEVDQGVPRGPVDFMSDRWRDLFKYVISEAKRLGLEINMNDDAGWNGSGGPWIKPEQAMQKLVWSEVTVEDPHPAISSRSRSIRLTLPRPQTVAGFYRDIVVLAFPAMGSYRLPNIQAKAMFSRAFIPPDTAAPQVPAEDVASKSRIIDVTSKLDTDGNLSWDAPAGKWTILRIGHTCTGAVNAPAPASGQGLECDKLSKQGAEAQFAGMMAKLIEDNRHGLGNALVATHVDSWENGMQNWTAHMREEFMARRGYDPIPFLPVITGRVVDSPEISERFLWDFRQTIADLTVENYAGRLHQLAKQNGLRFSIEAYDGTCDDMTYAGRADEPMGEFWIGGGAFQTLKEMASAAHTYGKPILGAEAFTADNRERWQEYPGSIKALGDRAFCDGVNRFVFHRYAMQPWLKYRPGMTMGPWGLHYERTNTWWEWSKPWHTYLARCQYLLRQGNFAADICYLQPEAAPQGFQPHSRRGYDYDNCTPEVVLTRMSVKNGRIVLPDGVTYRLLVLPEVKTMTPTLLRKVAELVSAGATVIGSRPERSPSLSGFPKCDEEVRSLAAAVWGNCDGQSIKEHAFGKGRVICGYSPEEVLNRMGVPQDFTGSAQTNWIHRRTKDTDIFFVANRGTSLIQPTCSFRVTGKRPELWDAETGSILPSPMFNDAGGVSRLPVRLEPSGSVFVVFRNRAARFDNIVRLERAGSVIWPGRDSHSHLTIRSARWGPAGQPNRTKDVTAQVRRLVEAGPGSFRVADLASEGDPALNVVKTLVVQYEVGSRKCSAMATDPELISLEPPADPIPSVRLIGGLQGSVEAEGIEPGVYGAHTAHGRTLPFKILSSSASREISGGWSLEFPCQSGTINLNSLKSWPEIDSPLVRYFSGTAVYRNSFTLPLLNRNRRLYLDLGRVEVMAQVRLNGRDLGILWKAPYCADITESVRSGSNTLEIKVVNQWINRLIGDEQLADDSRRNPDGTLQRIPDWVGQGKPSPAGRQAFTTWRLWKNNEQLRPSGLIGPVRILTAETVQVSR